MSVRNVGQIDPPLERCAILFMAGVGVGYLGDAENQWVGLPAVGIATALPFPGQARQGQYSAGTRLKSKGLGLVTFLVSYAVGVGVGANMQHQKPS